MVLDIAIGHILVLARLRLYGFHARLTRSSFELFSTTRSLLSQFNCSYSLGMCQPAGTPALIMRVGGQEAQEGGGKSLRVQPCAAGDGFSAQTHGQWTSHLGKKKQHAAAISRPCKASGIYHCLLGGRKMECT